jgi:Flp pilus assembly protein TadD
MMRILLALLLAFASPLAAQPRASDAGPPAEAAPNNDLLRAFDLLVEGDFVGALAMADAALAKDETDGFARAIRGLVLVRLNRPADALVDADRLTRDEPDEPGGWSLRGRALLMLGDLDGALADANTALRLQPDDSTALMLRGEAQYQRLNPGAAVADFEAVLRDNPDDVEAMANLAVAQRDLGRLEEALALLARAAALAPGAPSIVALQAETLRMLDRNDEARALMDRALKDAPDEPSLLLESARNRMAAGALPAARADVEAALAALPDHAAAIDLRCVLAVRMATPDRAAACAAAEALTWIMPRDVAGWQAWRAGIALLDGDEARARAAVDAALAAHPRLATALYFDGVLKQRAGDAAGAAASLAQARLLRPNIAATLAGTFGPVLPRPAP